MASHVRKNTVGAQVMAPFFGILCALTCTLAFGTVATAQTIENDDLRLRGIVGADGMTPEQQRQFLRSAERLADTDDTAPQEDNRETEDPITGSVPPVQSAGQVNPRQSTVDDQANLVVEDDPFGPVGIRVGRFVLRPSVTQQIAHEIDNDGDVKTERTYSRTVLRGELESDWSRHRLRIYGEQVLDKTISGDGPEDPNTLVEADLRLDVSETTTANLGFDYEFGRESQSDANAVGNAFAQSVVHEFDAAASIEHIFGLWRGRAAFDVGRSTFGDAELADGTIIDQSDRNETNYTVTLRAGRDIGSSHLPFVEGDFEQIVYDDELDNGGFARSSKTYGLRVGTAFDFGEKLNGELAVGYAQRDIDDPRLSPIRAVTINGYTNWSPRRGTDVLLALFTALEDSTTPNEPGSVYYTATTEVTRRLRENVDLDMSALIGWRDYTGVLNNQIVYGLGAGFTWWLNRRFGIEGGLSYEKTVTEGDGVDSDDFFAGIGIVLRP